MKNVSLFVEKRVDFESQINTQARDRVIFGTPGSPKVYTPLASTRRRERRKFRAFDYENVVVNVLFVAKCILSERPPYTLTKEKVDFGTFAPKYNMSFASAEGASEENFVLLSMKT